MGKWARFLPEPKQPDFTLTLCADRDGTLNKEQVKTFLRGMGLTIRHTEFEKKIFNKAAPAAAMQLVSTTSVDETLLSPNKNLPGGAGGGSSASSDNIDLFLEPSVPGTFSYSKEAVMEWFGKNKDYFQHDKQKAEKATETLHPHVSGGAKDKVSVKALKHVLANLGDDKISAEVFERALGAKTEFGGVDSVTIGELLAKLTETKAPTSYK
mmetsp:Transcript_18591/g.46397  ORF Transcript_18591/g.46397 Transcript_18591/m.46397 type:complete len:211 (+) Transcript_18591:80-712(+)